MVKTTCHPACATLWQRNDLSSRVGYTCNTYYITVNKLHIEYHKPHPLKWILTRKGKSFELSQQADSNAVGTAVDILAGMCPRHYFFMSCVSRHCGALKSFLPCVWFKQQLYTSVFNICRRAPRCDIRGGITDSISISSALLPGNKIFERLASISFPLSRQSPADACLW